MIMMALSVTQQIALLLTVTELIQLYNNELYINDMTPVV